MAAALPAWLARLEAPVAPSVPQTGEALLIDYPVTIGMQRQEWRHDLLREFQLIIHGAHDQRDHPHHVPRRLLELADQMTVRFGPAIERQTVEVERALAAGAESIVLRYPLVPSTRAMEIEFAKAMEDADAYCRDRALMTLAPRPEIYAMRRWFVEEVVRQYDGYPARPWPAFIEELRAESP